MPTISVIIPAYNAERTILETIASVQQQTFSDFELIVINDGSTDRTLELLGTVKDARLKIFSYENSGVSVARNRGISHAQGEFMAFVDADDLWTSDKLELQLKALQQHPEAGVAYSWTSYISEKGESLRAGENITFAGYIYANLLVWNFLDSGSNPLIRRRAIESVGTFDPTLTHGEDWELYLRLAACWPFTVVKKHQIFYRQAAGTASSKIEKMEQDVLRVIEKVYNAAPGELQSLKNQSLVNLYHHLAHLYLTRVPDTKQAKQASQKLLRAIRLQPRILLNKNTQILIIKLLLLQTLSPRIASCILQFFSKIRATHIQNSAHRKAFISS